MAEIEELDLASIPVLDLDTLTLGEMAEAERQTGTDFTALFARGSATRTLLRVFIHELRSSERPRSWHDLAALKRRAASSSISPSPPAGRPT